MNDLRPVNIVRSLHASLVLAGNRSAEFPAQSIINHVGMGILGKKQFVHCSTRPVKTELFRWTIRPVPPQRCGPTTP